MIYSMMFLSIIVDSLEQFHDTMKWIEMNSIHKLGLNTIYRQWHKWHDSQH